MLWQPHAGAGCSAAVLAGCPGGAGASSPAGHDVSSRPLAPPQSQSPGWVGTRLGQRLRLNAVEVLMGCKSKSPLATILDGLAGWVRLYPWPGEAWRPQDPVDRLPPRSPNPDCSGGLGAPMGSPGGRPQALIQFI